MRPLSDLVWLIAGRGGVEAKFGCESERDKFMCEVCAVADEDDLRVPDEEEQAEKLNPLPTPFQPILSQYLDHCIAHYPYQSWCPHCVEGRGREFGHYTHAKEPGVSPTIS